MRWEFLLILLGLLLAGAMLLTVIFGKQHGRHGYGATITRTMEDLAFAGPPTQLLINPGAPIGGDPHCKIARPRHDGQLASSEGPPTDHRQGVGKRAHDGFADTLV
ncbi:MAG: hypothetical protein P8Y84_11680 [Desulfuromonadales bacterium]